MTTELQEVIAELENSSRDFAAAFEGLPDTHAQVRPAEGRWSALDCAEHLFLVEERFLQRLQSAPDTKTATAIDRDKEAHLASMLGNRSHKATAPDAVQPAGRFPTLSEALQQLSQARARTIEFAQTSGARLYALELDHARFGAMNGAEFLKLTAFHMRRHMDQVREIRASLPIE
jgi:uncharacterized damage-inducible protein DinB